MRIEVQEIALSVSHRITTANLQAVVHPMKKAFYKHYLPVDFPYISKTWEIN